MLPEPEAVPLEDLAEDAFLDRAEACARAERELEVEVLRLAYLWAVRHPRERLDATLGEGPGREQPRRFGGEGTPEVLEFSVATLGARLGTSTTGARRLMADALDLHHRFPQLWARVEALEVRASYARYVVRQCRDLTAAQAGRVDARIAAYADGRVSWSRFEAIVQGLIVAADTEAARLREEQASRATFAKRTRGDAHGMATFMVRADAATIHRIDAAVTRVAGQLSSHTDHDSDPDRPESDADERRVEALMLLVCGRDAVDAEGNPVPIDTADLLPQVTLYVHTYAGVDALGVARVEGHGPVTEDWVRRLLGPRARFTIRPVLDLAGQAPVDAYEIPDRHRQAVHLMTPADTFPFANSTSREMEIDHTVPYHAGGVSGVGNYGPMTRLHHRIKTFAGWQVRQPFPGIYLWRDPYGRYCLVDHTGTRLLPRSPVKLDYIPAA